MNIAPELPDKADEPAGAGLKVDDQSGHTTVHLTGNWQAATIGSVNGPMQELAARAAPASAITLDLSGLGNLDTAGAWLITRLSNAWREKGGNVSLANVSEHRSRLLAAVDYTGETGERTGRSRNILLGPVEALGRVMYSLHRDTLMGFNIIGAAIHGPQLKSGKGGGVRPVSIIHHIDRMGLHSAPIIILVSFLIGGIIAQQSAFQMRTFGLENWAVGLTAILLLREVCVLITAIMIAGRSGSAMTAEIGSMKMREEVDALTVIGFPLGFHDTVHHLAVARSASIASAYGVRFQRQGYFLTDARTHRGSSGAPVLRRRSPHVRDPGALPWQLLGVHSTRMDMRTRDLVEDESLGLNCVWYADVLMTLTAASPNNAA